VHPLPFLIKEEKEQEQRTKLNGTKEQRRQENDRISKD